MECHKDRSSDLCCSTRRNETYVSMFIDDAKLMVEIIDAKDCETLQGM